MAEGMPSDCVARAMPTDEARHLLLRTSFGATDAELQALQAQPYDEGVDHLIADAARHTQAQTPPPSWTAASLPLLHKLQDASPEDRKSVV